MPGLQDTDSALSADSITDIVARYKNGRYVRYILGLVVAVVLSFSSSMLFSARAVYTYIHLSITPTQSSRT